MVYKKLTENLSRVIVGAGDVIDMVVISLIAQGHVLLEDVPGTGKTVLARSLARSISGGFRRVQFTPDLLPSDITGMMIFNPKTGEFSFRQGPVFTQVLLADEINRATPRTQSALLECMEERRVTVDGETKPLPEGFFVIATQNPIEIQGTFPLPEAQLDRFLMRLSMGFPTTDSAMAILDRFIESSPLDSLSAVVTAAELAEARAAGLRIHVSAPVREYVVALVEETRKHEDVSLGASPRGMLALLKAAQVRAMTRGRSFVLPDDVKALAEPVLGHRLMLKSGWRGAKAKSGAILNGIIAKLPVPTEIQ